MKCPYCQCTSAEVDEEEWEYKFCPSYPDKCSGCETDPDRKRCPACLEDFTTEMANEV